MRRLGLVGAVVLLAAAGCSDSDGDGAQPTQEERESAAVGSIASDMAEPVDTDQPHPCDRVTVAEMRELIGAKVTVTRTPETGTTAVMTCTFTAAALTTEALELPSITLSTTVDGGSLDDFATVMAATGGRASPVEVPGADEAIVVIDDDTDFPSVTAATEADGALLAAIVVADDAGPLSDIATRALALMID